jgi:hypothetical protein
MEALEQLGAEVPLAVARHAHLELADADQLAAAEVAGALARTRPGALIRFGAQQLGHLGFQHLLLRRAEAA